MFEIRIHGRGGQGAKSAAQLLAETALNQGKQIQAFAEYGPERSGAPVIAYARLDDKKILTHQPIIHPDVVMVLDPTLIKSVNVTAGLEKGGILIINTVRSAEEIKKELKFAGRVVAVDASKIALECVGKDIPNTPMLGALIGTTKIIDLNKLTKSIEGKFLKKLGPEKTAGNVRAVKRAYEEVMKSLSHEVIKR